MKSIAIVTKINSKVSSFLKENLELIFKDFVEIHNYSTSELKDNFVIKDDVVLFMTKERALDYEKHVLNHENIIVIERTVKNSELSKIFTLPQGTKVLVVNDNWQTTLETVAFLYQIGVNNLELIPYKSGESYENISISLTPDEESYVPKYIPTIINIGNRCIDTSTFIKIISKLGIENKLIDERLINYSEDIINLNEGIKNSYKELFVKKDELNTIVNLSKDGVLFIDNGGNIIFCNKVFRSMFRLENEEIYNKKMEHTLQDEVVQILRKPVIKDELLEFDGKYLNVNKKEVISLGQSIGFYLNVQEITYIMQLEQNLSKKLRNKGLIAKYSFSNIKTRSQKMQECISLAKKISSSHLTTLIVGESGTGKELLAQSIHNLSSRTKQPFVAINCAALPENLLESELFGYEGGAFTGALKEGKIGLFEQANNGTIFLDEIGDMPLSLQCRLLRVLQERQVMRIGSLSLININVRIIAATNKNLRKMVEEGTFREDLFYRLNVLPINVPPLRERKEDIIPILKSFIKKNLSISEEVEALLLNYTWPGNIRELQNVASYLELMCDIEAKLKNLPYYITQCSIDFNKEFKFIENRFNILTTIKVLKIIDEKNAVNVRVGRKNIEETLNNLGNITTEAEIRRLLATLNDLGLVVSNPGRRGSEITTKGKDFIKWVDNRS